MGKKKGKGNSARSQADAPIFCHDEALEVFKLGKAEIWAGSGSRTIILAKTNSVSASSINMDSKSATISSTSYGSRSSGTAAMGMFAGIGAFPTGAESSMPGNK